VEVNSAGGQGSRRAVALSDNDVDDDLQVILQLDNRHEGIKGFANNPPPPPHTHTHTIKQHHAAAVELRLRFLKISKIDATVRELTGSIRRERLFVKKQGNNSGVWQQSYTFPQLRKTVNVIKITFALKQAPEGPGR
jgi:hypothetical protein